jgi:hypothetical protein
MRTIPVCESTLHNVASTLRTIVPHGRLDMGFWRQRPRRRDERKYGRSGAAPRVQVSQAGRSRSDRAGQRACPATLVPQYFG